MVKLLSVRAYAKKTNQSFQKVYRAIIEGRLETVIIEKKVKRIPWAEPEDVK